MLLMLRSIVLSSLLLVSPTRAGPPAFDFRFQLDFCSIEEESLFPNFSAPVLSPHRGQHLHAESCNHEYEHAHSYISPVPALSSLKPTDFWTYSPRCLSATSSHEYCVYTNSSFAANRGISFFTTPSIAARLKHMPAFTLPSLPPHTNNFSNAPWEIRNIPKRGNGLFATRTLHRGDLILADTPIAVLQSDAFFPDYDLGYEFLHRAIDQLPLETQKLHMRMATFRPGDEAMERINTNAFAGNFGGEPHFLLYPETALMNHDCRPNAMYHPDFNTLVHTTYASRTIEPGEEITITYINMIQPRAERQEQLQSRWGFKCTCATCSLGAHKSSQSDDRISKIISLQPALSDGTQDSAASPAMAEELVRLYVKEDIHAGLGTAHMLAAYTYNRIGDSSMAKRHARKALQYGIYGSSDRAKEEDEMKALRASPTQHWSYMERRR